MKTIQLEGQRRIVILREDSGVPRIQAENEVDLYQGLGYCHATDRGMQMLLTRILGYGRACELLDDTDELLELDLFFHRFNYHTNREEELAQLTPHALACLEGYCKGVNERLNHRLPAEFRLLLRYKFEPWVPYDCLLLTRMTAYISLAQTQTDLESLLVQMIQGGVSRDRLEELFPNLLDGIDLELIQKVKHSQKLVPESLIWNTVIPKITASNNWVLSGSKTTSGKPLLASDPHMEINRLPNVWYEVILNSGSAYMMGATIPGLPSVIIGRNNYLAWGVTYTYMDAVDSWIEECQNGAHRRNQDWVPFQVYKKTILRKKNPPHELTLYANNEHGVLDGDPHVPGFYLATRWTGDHSGARSINHALQLWHAQTAKDALASLGQIEASFNWIVADREGNIGYQMSGLMPKRGSGKSGMFPLPGWNEENDWKGLVSPGDLPQSYNPPEGFFVTANQNLNKFGNENPTSCCQGSFRSDRISALLREKDKYSVEDMFKIQYDDYSLQAELFMKVIGPVLPSTTQGKILRSWDCRYGIHSEGAYLFEKIYLRLLKEVFGKMGKEVFEYLESQTGILKGFFPHFDRILLSENSLWFANESRNQIYCRVVEEELKDAAVKPWGDVHRIDMQNLFFAGKLPKILGFDRGPISIPGCRSTVAQGQVFEIKKRKSCFFPAIRMVTDLATDEIHTNLAGGISDRRFSRLYCSDLRNWLNGKYKVLKNTSRSEVTYFARD